MFLLNFLKLKVSRNCFGLKVKFIFYIRLKDYYFSIIIISLNELDN